MDDARDTALSLMRKVGASPHAIAQLRTVDATAGYARFLQWRAEHFLPENAPWFQRAQVLADAGYGQQALDALGRSVAAREPFAIKIGSTPSFASLRANRRFRRLAAQVGVRV